MDTIADLEKAVKKLFDAKSLTEAIATEVHHIFEHEEGIIYCTGCETHMYMRELGFVELEDHEKENFNAGYRRLSSKARKFYKSLKRSGYYDKR